MKATTSSYHIFTTLDSNKRLNDHIFHYICSQLRSVYGIHKLSHRLSKKSCSPIFPYLFFSAVVCCYFWLFCFSFFFFLLFFSFALHHSEACYVCLYSAIHINKNVIFELLLTSLFPIFFFSFDAFFPILFHNLTVTTVKLPKIIRRTWQLPTLFGLASFDWCIQILLKANLLQNETLVTFVFYEWQHIFWPTNKKRPEHSNLCNSMPMWRNALQMAPTKWRLPIKFNIREVTKQKCLDLFNLN